MPEFRPKREPASLEETARLTGELVREIEIEKRGGVLNMWAELTGKANIQRLHSEMKLLESKEFVRRNGLTYTPSPEYQTELKRRDDERAAFLNALGAELVELAEGVIPAHPKSQTLRRWRAQNPIPKPPTPAEIPDETATNANPKSALEIERETERLTGRTTTNVLMADFDIPKSTLGGLLRKWRDEGLISVSGPQTLPPAEVTKVRELLRNWREKRAP
jgi:hypothetical protein